MRAESERSEPPMLYGGPSAAIMTIQDLKVDESLARTQSICSMALTRIIVSMTYPDILIATHGPGFANTRKGNNERAKEVIGFTDT
jgi:hypothetical protein